MDDQPRKVLVSNDSKAAPEWEPPRHIKDPLVRRQLVATINPKRKNDGRHLWSKAIQGRLPKLADYAVARGLAVYGNADGTSCRPGLARLAASLSTSEKSVQRSMDYLAEHGWIHLENPGIRHRGEANEYTLSVPGPVAAEHGWWTDGECQWIERPAAEPTRPAARQGGHPRPPYDQEGGHSRPGRWTPVSEKVDAGVHPPVSTTNKSKNHHSDSLNPPRADARGSTSKPQFDQEDPDLSELIEEHLEERLAGPVRVDTATMITGMVERGAHPKMIVNAAMANERRDDAW